MGNIESGVPLQTDQLSTVPGGAIRTVTVTVPVNGVPTQVQMQVVCIADSNGNLLDASYDPRQVLKDIADVLKDLRVMMSRLSDSPFVDNQEQTHDNPGIIP